MSSQNITITVTGGTMYYQNPNQLCLPSSATDIIVFFFANYLAHVATVRSRPHHTWVDKLVARTFCLFLPAFGLSIAVPMIVSCAYFAKTPLQMATRAGALVMVVRNDKWKPDSTTECSCAILNPRPLQSKKSDQSSTPKASIYVIPEELIKTWEAWAAFVWGSAAEIELDNEKLNIIIQLPPEYSLRIVPCDAVVEEANKDQLVKIKYSTNFSAVIVAVVQLVYALISLYHARIHQIAKYGYAAFSISIVPYAVMSFVNLISIVFCPDFSNLYLVDSSILSEARRRLRAQEQQDNQERQDNQEYLVKEIPVVGTLAEEDGKRVDTSQIDMKRSIVGLVTVGVEVKFTSNENGIPTSPDQEAKKGLVGNTERLKDEYAVYIPSSRPPKRYLHPIHRVLCPSKEMEDALPKLTDPWRRFSWSIQDTFIGLFLLIFYGGTLAIVGGISRFKPGQSTLAQRVWIVMWLVTSLAWVLIDLAGDYVKTRRGDKNRKAIEGLQIIAAVLFAAPALGGFGVAGKMLHEYGTCTLLS